MKFYLDENVAASVQHVLEDAGHEVIWTRDITGQGAADDVVAAVSENDRAVLVSHDKDFKKIAPRIPDGQRQRFRRLNMVRLQCTKPRAAERFSKLLVYIEFDYNHRQAHGLGRSIVEIRPDVMTIYI